MTERKLKKWLQKEADMFMRAKKEDMLAFYQPTKTKRIQKKMTFYRLKEEKRVQKRRFPVRTIVAASFAILLLAAVVFVASFGGRSVVDLPTSDSEASSGPASESSVNIAHAVPLWFSALGNPFAAVEIVEVTDETVNLFQYHVSSDYTKIKCKVLFSYRTEIFTDPEYTQNNGMEEKNRIPFDELQEIYVRSDSVADVKQYDVIFFHVVEMNLNNDLYYGPLNNLAGQAEFLPFIEDQLSIPEGAFETASFDVLAWLNRGLEQRIWKYRDEESYKELFAACPKYLFEDGLSVAEAKAFFQSCKVLREVAEVQLDVTRF